MARRAHTFLLFIQDQTAAGGTHLDRGALPGGITLVAGETDAGHGADRQGVQDSALGIQATRLGQGARVDALAADAGSLRRTVLVRSAANLDYI